jgi:hypothetical protein
MGGSTGLGARISEALESDCLTEWEKNFLVSIKTQLNQKGTLSAKQIKVLMNIEEKIEKEGGTAEKDEEPPLKAVDDFVNNSPF